MTRSRCAGRRLLLAAVVGLSCWAAAPAAADDRLQPVGAGEFRAILAQHRGQVVLVNFWATWCRPCLREIPALMSLESRLADRGFALVPVSLDDPDSLDSVVLPFMEKWFPRFRSYASLERDMDAMVSVVDRAWNEILPTSYLLDRDGTVAKRLQGGKSEAEFEAEVLALLD